MKCTVQPFENTLPLSSDEGVGNISGKEIT